ncbi:hypothetical protein ACIP6I_22820 [Streptomyces anulatus]
MFWKATGRIQRATALLPTLVCRGDVVAGHGPPWCMAAVTDASGPSVPYQTSGPQLSHQAVQEVLVIRLLALHGCRETARQHAQRFQ